MSHIKNFVGFYIFQYKLGTKSYYIKYEFEKVTKSYFVLKSYKDEINILVSFKFD